MLAANYLFSDKKNNNFFLILTLKNSSAVIAQESLTCLFYLPCFHTLNVLERKNITEKQFFFCSWSEPTRQPRLSGFDVAACAAGRGLVSPDSPGRLGPRLHARATRHFHFAGTQTYKSPSGAEIVFLFLCLLCLFFFYTSH